MIEVGVAPQSDPVDMMGAIRGNFRNPGWRAAERASLVQFVQGNPEAAAFQICALDVIDQMQRAFDAVTNSNPPIRAVVAGAAFIASRANIDMHDLGNSGTLQLFPDGCDELASQLWRTMASAIGDEDPPVAYVVTRPFPMPSTPANASASGRNEFRHG